MRSFNQHLGLTNHLLFTVEGKHGLGLFNLHPASLIYLPIVVVYLPRSIAQQIKINKFVKADSLPALLGVIPIFNFVQQFDQFGFEAGFLAHFTHSRIFRRFDRAHGKRTVGGSGLGLAIVDAITKGHGGSCTVTDTPGGGATFTIHLPPAAAELPAPVRAGDVLQRETSA